MIRTKSNIVLIGFMGAGKTTVGKVLAGQLGKTFVDLDEYIIKKAGHSVAEIFEEVGESGFRQLESTAVAELSQQTELVLATGGGTVINQNNFTRLRQTGVVIYLNPSYAVLEEHIRAGGSQRPLARLNANQLLQLYQERQAWYDLADYQVTYGVLDNLMAVVAVAEEIKRLLKPGTPTLVIDTPTSQYFYWLGRGLFTSSQLACLPKPVTSKALLVTDETVGGLYADLVTQTLSQLGWDLARITFPAGEEQKRLENLELIWEQGFQHGVDRKGCIFALGGGVIGDLAGFAAATYMRGINFVNFPTTLLAMVDSSIGGKVGVNHARGKNLVGAFHHPQSVIASIDILDSLDERNLAAGWGEVIKTALIGDPVYYRQLVAEQPGLRLPETQVDAVFRSAKVKVAIVQRDEHEQGLRKLLNLGHTLGHGLEQALGYGKLLHGEAVAIGMVAAVYVAQRLGLAEAPLTSELKNLLTHYRLPVAWPRELGVTEVTTPVLLDKKNQSGQVTMLLPIKPGEIVEEALTVTEFNRLMEAFRGEA